jgi:glyoxylase-like metal-dependent hydrolase (beta-lactamase superfamily II)
VIDISVRNDTAEWRWEGGSILPYARCVLAPNPGPMTLDGTNTWLLGAPGSRDVVVVDPGPDDATHLERVAALALASADRVRAILLTHGHLDHSAGARALSRRLGGAPVRALDPAWVFGGEGLRDGDELRLDGLRVAVVGTPGHTSDSLCFLATPDDEQVRPDPIERSVRGPLIERSIHSPGGAVLTGDTVLGRGTSVIAHPDGRLGDYLASLRRLSMLATERALGPLLPGHGPVLDDPVAVLDAYLRHRAQRLDEVRAALAAGASTAADVVEQVYPGIEPALRAAAERSVQAQLAYLHDHG